MPSKKLFAIGSIVLLCLQAAGCGKAQPTSVVTGTVTYNGKPLPGGVISFFCPDGVSGASDIGSDGSFRVEKLSIGEAMISVKGPVEVDETVRHMAVKQARGVPTATPPAPAPKLNFPAKYTDVGTSNLKFDVKAGENKFDLPLTP